MTEASSPIDLDGNPFAALFPSMDDAVLCATLLHTTEETSSCSKNLIDNDSSMLAETDDQTFDVNLILNNLLQRVFLITLQRSMRIY